jgi:hypothetical protein
MPTRQPATLLIVNKNGRYKMCGLNGGINRRQLDQLFVGLGGSIRKLNRTGEIQYSHPMLAETPRADGRRKDAPRHLVAFVRRVQRMREGSSCL